MPLPCRRFAHAQHSAGSFSVTLSTQHSLTLHDHIHTMSYPKYVGGAVKFVYTSTYFLIHHDVQFVHHRSTLALFSPPTVDISVQIAQQCLLPAYGSLRQFDLWSHCRSQQYHNKNTHGLPQKHHSSPLEATALLSSTSCIITGLTFGTNNNDNKVIPMYNHSSPMITLAH